MPPLDSMLLLLVLVALPFAAWSSPRWLRHAAVRLMTRAEVVEAQRSVHAARLKHWSRELCGEAADEPAA